ncbi:MAG: hypothetical protein VB099_09755 [Candidatus Limiplasma sp.]|nr:hypothetical protein [Candidatus Limiplasma sp.]
MKDLFEILQKIDADNRQAYLDTMSYCGTRVSADEGIPTVIALDDLTRPGCDAAFETAEADRDLGMALAAKALLFTSLYEAKEKAEDDKYPSICPAMSAATESCFRLEYHSDGDFTAVPYRDVVGRFIRQEDGEVPHER